MKKTLIWLALSLPWITGSILLVVFCTRAYAVGESFSVGLHAFRWFSYMAVGAVVFLPAVGIAGGVVLGARKQLKESRLLRWTAILSPITLLIPFIALPAMSWSFLAGRAAAYRSLDYEAIYAAGAQLREGVLESGSDFFSGRWEESPAALPPAIAAINPLEVTVTRDAVTIQMDGGGVMYHEGIGMVFSEDAARSLPRDGIKPLHDSLPVYLYRLYDYTIFLDAAREAGAGSATQ